MAARVLGDVTRGMGLNPRRSARRRASAVEFEPLPGLSCPSRRQSRSSGTWDPSTAKLEEDVASTARSAERDTASRRGAVAAPRPVRRRAPDGAIEVALRRHRRGATSSAAANAPFDIERETAPSPAGLAPPTGAGGGEPVHHQDRSGRRRDDRERRTARGDARRGSGCARQAHGRQVSRTLPKSPPATTGRPSTGCSGRWPAWIPRRWRRSLGPAISPHVAADWRETHRARALDRGAGARAAGPAL